MSLPNDPMMLFSFINMKLRDNYSSLDDLCEDLQVNKKSLLTKKRAEISVELLISNNKSSTMNINNYRKNLFL